MKYQTEQGKSDNYIGLDLVRGCAALVVLAGHCRALTLQTYSQTTAGLSLLSKLFYFITGLGPQAVIVFFVLSGFFIFRSIDNSYKNGSFSFGFYFNARLSRLWTVLIPAILITLVFDNLGLKIASAAPFYSGNIAAFPIKDLSNLHSFHILIGNAFFLQTILVPTFGSNGPLWSLSWEFWFYMFFPFLYLSLLAKDRSKISRVISFSVMVFLLFLIAHFNYNVVLYFIVWLFGGISYLVFLKIYERRISIPRLIIGLILFCAALTLSRLQIINLKLADFFIGLAVASLIPSLARLKLRRITSLSKFLSQISYTVYAIHFPILAFITSFLGLYNLIFNAHSLLIFTLIFIFTLSLGYLIWWMFERNTNYVRRFFNEILLIINRSFKALQL